LRPKLARHGRKLTIAGACCTFFLCWTAPNALADYRFDNWTTDSGLPNNSVHGIVQTPDGYLWFATSDGLARYDGVRFTTYNKGNSKGIATNRLGLLYTDTSGTLWATIGPGGLIRYKDSSFTTYTRETGLPDDRVWCVSEDAGGAPLILTSHGIFRVSGDGFLPYSSPDGVYKDQYAVDSSFIFAGLSYADQAGLRVFNGGGYSTYPRSQWPAGMEIKSAHQNEQGPLWIWSRNGTLYKIKDGVFTAYPISEYSRKDVVSACEDNDGGIWVSIWDVGLGLLKDGRFRVYTAADGIPATQLDQVYKDREGNIWASSETMGLFRVRKATVTVLSRADGIAGNNIYPIYQDGKGDIWVGTQNDGLSRIRGGVITNFRREGSPPGTIITALCEESDGYLWIGSTDGVSRFKERGTPQFDRPAGLPGFFALAMTAAREGGIWLGGPDGLARYKDGVFTAYKTSTFGEGSDARAVVNIYEDSQGYLWLGTLAGLIRFKNGAMTTYTERDGLPSNHVRAIYQDSEGVLWFGTYDGGLVRLKGDSFKTISTKDGLFSNGVFQILEDSRGNFWMSSNQGIYRAARQDLNDLAEGRIQSVACVSFGKADGLLNAECNGGRQPAGCKDRAGRVWFPTQQGVAIIDPLAVPINQDRPPVRIEEIAINRKPVPLADMLYIYPGQDNLEMTYTALSFVDSERIRFKYMLEGLDRDWTDVGTQRTAYLSRIPPGRYTFRVIAANSDGLWNETGAAIRLVVVPPFYRTWWFFTLSGITAVGIVALAYNRRIARIRKAQRVQEAFSKQLIEYQEQERKRIAAELHDGLSQSLVVIKNRAIMAQSHMQDLDAMGEQLDEIGSSASQAIDEVREIAHNLRPVLLDRLGLTKALESMLRKVAAANRMELAYEIAPLEGVFPKEAEVNLYRILQETINNIVKHSGASAAAVRITRSDGLLHLVVRDNGKGFDTEEASRKGGFGLIGIIERARILGGEAAVRSSPGSGTTIEIRFKLKGDTNGR